MPDSLEVFINEQRADVAFFRIMLTVFLMRTIGQLPLEAQETALRGLQGQVMHAVGNLQKASESQGEDRFSQLLSVRAEKFFAELRQVLPIAPDTPSPRVRN